MYPKSRFLGVIIMHIFIPVIRIKDLNNSQVQHLRTLQQTEVKLNLGCLVCFMKS